MALTSARQILNKKILGGDSSADVQELKVEVAALSASVLTIGEKVENISEYSTTEKVVGKWIDGSDIYETVLEGTLDTITDNVFVTKYVSIAALNANNIIYYDIMIYQDNIRVKIPYTTNAGLLLKAHVNLNDHTVEIVSNSSAYSEKDFVVVLRYTKTAAESKKKTTKKK